MPSLRVHNALRGLVPGLSTLTDAGQTQAELEDLHFKERAYRLWLTSHRLGDLRRMVRQYGRVADDVFPIGPNAPTGSRATSHRIFA